MPDAATHANPAYRRAKRNARLIVVAAAAVVFAVAVALLFVLLPYDAMRVYSVEPTARVVCQGDIVATRRDYEIFARADVWEVEVLPYWEVVDVPGYPKGARLPDPEGKYAQAELRPGRRTVTSSILRSAPKPGLWRIGSDTTARGTPYAVPFPKAEFLALQAKPPVRVLGYDDPRCAPLGRGEEPG